MSDTEGREVLHREFAAELEADGRNIDVRIVPFNVAQRVVDPPPRGTGVPYEEMWLSGVFDNQATEAHRVLANFEHEQGSGGIVARGTELRDTGEAAEATFRALDGPDGDKILDLVGSGSVTGVSLEAKPLKSVREDGMVKRVKAHLINIAFCRTPAFPQAEVLAVRTEVEIPPATVSEEVSERLARIGFEPMVRRTLVTSPWDNKPDRFDDEQWQTSCILDRGTGFDGAKSRFAIPVLEPTGELNLNAMRSAARKLNQTFTGDKPAAARKLLRYYRMAGETPDPSLTSTASR